MASGFTGVLPELLSQSQILGLIQPQAVEQAKRGAFGCHCCIPSLGGVVLPLRHVFSLSLSVKLNFLWGQVAKAKPHSGIAALCQLLPLSDSVLEPPRQAAKQSQGSLWNLSVTQRSPGEPVLVSLSYRKDLAPRCWRWWQLAAGPDISPGRSWKATYVLVSSESRNSVARNRSTLYMIMASLE